MARICHVRLEWTRLHAKSSFRDYCRIRQIKWLLFGLGYFVQVRTAVRASVVVDPIMK
jgi:hypothetical protein